MLPLFSRRLSFAVVSFAIAGLAASCQVGKGPSQSLTAPMPSSMPGEMPTAMPSEAPTGMPTAMPTGTPSTMPTAMPSPSASMAPVAMNAYALTQNNGLIAFDRNDPTTAQAPMAITGLAAEEMLVGIDFRATDMMIYAVSNQGRIYSIDADTGMATAAAEMPFEGGVMGTHFGVDFNPTVDRVRLHSDETQNLRLHPDTGARLAVDGTLAYLEGDSAFGAAPVLVATAYTNPVPNAESTQLYAIDSAKDTLVLLPSPNDGGVTTVGSLGIDVSEDAALDINVEGEAYAILSVNNSSAVYRIDLSTGLATQVGMLGDQPIIGMALVL